MKREVKRVKPVISVVLALMLTLAPMTSFATEVNEVDETTNTTTEENTVEPATTEPATTEPATTEPATTEPATTEPATTEPATTEPATTEPATTEPATTESATTESDDTESETTEADNTDDAETISKIEYPCQTQCSLDHDHQSEICEISYYGTFLDWDSVPYVWEYNWDNSEQCWYYGMWQDGLCYTTPENTYDIDVRHKIALYSDGEYLYLNVIQATVNGPNRISGTTLEFTVDGVKTQFQLVTSNGTTLESVTSPGTYEVYVNHDLGEYAGAFVEDSKAYVYVNDTTYNSEFEVKIPLSALAEQNPDVDLDNINEITFFSSSLTYKGITIGGISTYPFILATVCVAGVGFVVYKKTKKKKIVGV